MELRDIKFEDLSYVGEIASDSFDDYSYDDFLKMSRDKNYKFIVALKNEIIVGFVVFLNIDDKLEIIKIATSRDYRRQGVGRCLIKFMQDYVISKNRTGVILEVNEKNLPARNLYLKMGFVQIFTRKKYYHNTDDAIIMEWLK